MGEDGSDGESADGLHRGFHLRARTYGPGGRTPLCAVRHPRR
ncbi:hypothetical protein SBD_3871 [Streptomyces bottropensis ATCC 25435]|uniref:Uncharacterized protein n=1 Tax=Streptomyces bottropensis ATCC 25435 TaxID=1054862 RepID=M3FQ27_9ACTN|nr:hypothetical protein SBD_3871 [Streptomyces bottropensis ATCC 25435]